jgi:hypothetical protein
MDNIFEIIVVDIVSSYLNITTFKLSSRHHIAHEFRPNKSVQWIRP